MVDKMIFANKEFDIKNNTYVMGILNVTPDSFSDGSKFNTLDKALFHTKEMIEQGAAIIDVGGESTRRGYTMISDEEEIERVCPVIERISKEFDTVISIDTYKSGVADAALKSGAHILNDIHGLKYDKNIAGVAAKYNAGICIMHNADDMSYRGNSLDEYIDNVKKHLLQSLEIAKAAGVDMSKVMIDPGVGFAKDLEMNLMITNNVDSLLALDYPVLLATSRKSMIGLTLDLPSDEREEGTLVTTVMGVMKGVSFVRVHDVKKNVRAIRMTRAILNSGRYQER